MSNWGTPARTIRIEAGLWDAVQMKAEREGSNASEVIRRLLTEWVGQ